MRYLSKFDCSILGSWGLGATARWAQAPTPTTPASVTGQVQQAANRRPLPGATVRLVRLPNTATAPGTQTDERGRYALRAVPAGRYEVRARASPLVAVEREVGKRSTSQALAQQA